MRFRQSEILRLAKGLLAAPESALDCGQAAEWLPAAVDAAIAGEDVARGFPDLAAHLKFCSPCLQAFEDLVEIARRAESASLPQPVGVQPSRFRRIIRQATARKEGWRGKFLARFRKYMEQVQSGLGQAGDEAVPRLARTGQAMSVLLVGPREPSLQMLPVRGRKLSQVWQRDYELAPLKLRLTLKAREFDRHRFTLRGLIEGKTSFAGMGVALLARESGELLDAARVDSTNTFSFHNLGPGCYEIRLDVSESEAITLTGVDI